MTTEKMDRCRQVRTDTEAKLLNCNQILAQVADQNQISGLS